MPVRSVGVHHVDVREHLGLVGIHSLIEQHHLAARPGKLRPPVAQICGAGVGVVGAAGVRTQNHVLMAFLVDKMDVAMGIVFGHVGVIEARVPFGPEADADRAAGDIGQPVVHRFQGGRPVRARRGGRRLPAAARQKQAGRKGGGKCTVFHSAPPCF